ncbi:MAG: AAA family ATPase, partial [Bacteroidales bacterium]|nr:AAA family ATPase [Bacteroidales bacterium]
MRRKIYDQLLQWKSQNGERALMLNGARRVGKSYIAEEFAKREYRSYLKIDFNDISEENKAIILSHLSDRDRLFSYLQLAYGVKLYERQSLILFDEIQMCPKVRGAIKYLVADGRYDYIETGSLLSIQENVKDILIPSEEDYITLFPMDFEEFMWACGQEELMEYVKQCFA